MERPADSPPPVEACPVVDPAACQRTSPQPGRVSPDEAGVVFTALLPDVPCGSFDRQAFRDLVLAAANATGPARPPTVQVRLLQLGQNASIPVGVVGMGRNTTLSASPALAGGRCSLAVLAQKACGQVVWCRVDFDRWWEDVGPTTCFFKSFLLETWLEEEGRLDVRAAAPRWLQDAFGPTASVTSLQTAPPLSVQQAPPPPPPPLPHVQPPPPPPPDIQKRNAQ